MEEYYDKKKGLSKTSGNFIIALGPQDKLLGSKIIDIVFSKEKEEPGPELTIHLDNGSQIEIYQCVDGTIFIESD